MKKTIYTAAFLTIGFAAFGQVGIGTPTPDTSSLLDLTSTTKGLLKPRMTGTQRGAIVSPATGLEVFDTTTNTTWYYNGTSWINSASAAISDLRLVGTRNHITQDAGKSSNGTDGGGGATSGDNIAIGTSALGNIGAGVNNIAIGTNALSTNVGGQNNIAVGLAALSVNTASYNTAIGIVALQNNAGGAENTSVGYSTLTANIAGNSNVAVGSQSLRNNTGSSNVAVGAVALNGNVGGVNNTAVGTSALQVANANYNTAVGLDALRNTTTGGSNTALGFSAGSALTTGTANIIVGQAAQVNDPAGAYQLSIGNVIYGNNMGNTAAGNIGIGTNAPTTKLHVKIENQGLPNTSGTTQTAGQYARYADNSGLVLDMGGNGGYGNWLQSTNAGNLGLTYPLLLNPNGGNVGVGTATPQSALHVSNALPTLLLSQPTTPTATDAGIGVVSFGANNGAATVAVAASVVAASTQAWTTATQGSKITFNTTNNGTISQTAKMTIDQNGYVGIGIVTPQVPLHLRSNIGFPVMFISNSAVPNTSTILGQVRFGAYNGAADVYGAGITAYATQPWSTTGIGSQLRFFTDTNGTTAPSLKMVIDQDGSVLPALNGTQTLGSISLRWGQIYSSNATVSTSDRRLKTNIKDVSYGLLEVMKMRPVTYNWKTDANNNNMVGFIAQEMEKIIPEAVEAPKKADEFYGMKYTELIPVLTKAIQEQQAQIETLKKINSDLLTRVEKLEKH